MGRGSQLAIAAGILGGAYLLAKGLGKDGLPFGSSGSSTVVKFGDSGLGTAKSALQPIIVQAAAAPSFDFAGILAQFAALQPTVVDSEPIVERIIRFLPSSRRSSPDAKKLTDLFRRDPARLPEFKPPALPSQLPDVRALFEELEADLRGGNSDQSPLDRLRRELADRVKAGELAERARAWAADRANAIRGGSATLGDFDISQAGGDRLTSSWEEVEGRIGDLVSKARAAPSFASELDIALPSAIRNFTPAELQKRVETLEVREKLALAQERIAQLDATALRDSIEAGLPGLGDFLDLGPLTTIFNARRWFPIPGRPLGGVGSRINPYIEGVADALVFWK